MSEHQTHSQDRFTSHKKAHLFETSSNTVCRHKRQVSIDLRLLLKQISDSSEIDSQLHDNEELSEESISTSLRSESSIMTFQDSVDQNTSNDQDNDNQQSSSQNTILAEHNAVICQQEFDVKFAKLEIRKLKLLTVHELSILNTDSDQNNIVHNFKKKITIKNLKLSFKLDDMNYNF